jgi:predicted enzyme related to lactoylglutathione lyase
MALILFLPAVALGEGLPQRAAPIVFFDIAGPELSVQKTFYADLFGWQISETNQLSVPVAASLPGALRMDPMEKRLYIGVDDVAKKLDEIKAHGGTIDAPRFVVPGVVILGLFKDPAGNPMGLVEMANGKPKIP